MTPNIEVFYTYYSDVSMQLLCYDLLRSSYSVMRDIVSFQTNLNNVITCTFLFIIIKVLP